MAPHPRLLALRAAINRGLLHGAAKPVLFGLSVLPMAWLVWAALQDNLGANPAETLIRSLGTWALRFLCATLAVTPLRVTLGIPALARLRRMLGLFMYAYVVLHLLAYAWFDMGLDATDIALDIAKRPFILVGFASFLLLTPLAATSFNRTVKALGAARWRRLHQAVYAIAVLAVLHFFWMRAGKNNFTDVIFYGLALAMLLAWRVVHWWHGRQARPPMPSPRFSR